MAKAWYDPSGWFEGDSELKTQTVVTDPNKKAVSDALGSYYASQIGKGATAYPGTLTVDLDPLARSRYNEFLGTDPSAWFQSAVTDPTLKAFTRDVLPEINES